MYTQIVRFEHNVNVQRKLVCQLKSKKKQQTRYLFDVSRSESE